MQMRRTRTEAHRSAPHAAEALLLLAVLALALALRLHFFFGLVRPDSLDYAHDAVNLLRGAAVFTEQANPIHVTRLTVTLPLALAYRLFGYGELAAVAWPLFASVAGVAVTYLAGRALLGARVGLLAALLVALHPLDIAYATQLLPDGILAAFLTLSAVCVLAGLATERRRWWLAAGLALGLGYYARLNAPVLLGVFGLWVLALRRPWRDLVWLGAGILVILAGAALVFTLWGGDPLYDLRRSFAPLAAPENRDVFRASYTLEHFTVYVRWLLAPPVRVWTALALVGAVVGWRVERRVTVLVLLWLGWLLLYFEVLSQWPIVSMPEKGDRFVLPILQPLALLGGLALDTAARGRRDTGMRGHGDAGTRGRQDAGKAARHLSASPPLRVAASPLLRVSVLGALLGLAVLPALARLPVEAAALRAWRAAEPRAIAAALEILPPRPVYVTTNWIPWLNLFLGFPGLAPSDGRLPLERLRFGDLGRPAPVPDAYVVHDRGVILNRPLAWREVATPTARSVIYRAPADAPPPCAEGMTSPPSPLSARGEGERGGEVATCAGPEAYVMEVEAELFRGLAPPDSAAPIGAGGWTWYAQGFYSAGGAAITRLPGTPIWQNIWQLPPGEYRVVLRVYEQGNGGRNVLAVRLNHAVGVVRWQGEQPGVREVEVAVADPDGGNLLALTPLFVGQGTLIVDRVSITRAPAPWRQPTRGPLVREAEDADGLALAPGGDYSRADGWTSYAMPFYSGGRAAITRAVGRTIALPLPALAAGDYEVTVTVYDYGNGGENVLEIALNGVVADLRWGGDAVGVRDVHLTLRGVGAGDDLRLRALRNGQGYVIVDALRLMPR